MPANIAINGFGRIGRLVLRSLLQRYKKELTVVAVNDQLQQKPEMVNSDPYGAAWMIENTTP